MFNLLVSTLIFLGGYEPEVERIAPPTEVTAHPSIRFLVLHHANEPMAAMDAKLATNAAKEAAKSGLPIKILGTWLIAGVPMEKMKTFIAERLKEEATSGDILIIHTIGHGSPNGLLVNLGSRKAVIKLFAEVAEEQKQRVFWWQLSCHACAELPDVGKVSKDNYFCVLASSPASQQSASHNQSKIMSHLFQAMATNSKKLDANGDGVITGKELRDYINSYDNLKRGDLFFARNLEDPVFWLPEKKEAEGKPEAEPEKKKTPAKKTPDPVKKN